MVRRGNYCIILMKTKDETGKIFGKLSVLSRDGSIGGKAAWSCQCECGNFTTVTGDKLRRKSTVSCGCYHGSFKSIDLGGKRFGMLVAVKPTKRIDSRKRTFWECTCDCGNIAEVRVDSLNRGVTKSCGCLLRGENSHLWNDKLDDVIRCTDRRYALGVVAWRKAIYEKDGYACQCCGDRTGGNLNAHHIESWDMNPKLRFNLDNGVTLCDVCHKDFHIMFGYGDNTQEQFLEFLKRNSSI